MGGAPPRKASERLCEGTALLPGCSSATARPPASPAPEVSCSGAPPGAATSETRSCYRRSHGEYGDRGRGPLPVP